MENKPSKRLNESEIRKDFPILNRMVRPGVKLVYLDSAATSQKPIQVIETMNDYYRNMNANIHRGVHTLAEEATAAYEATRSKVARFIHARHSREIIYTRNTTESINLVAYTWGRANLKKGDIVILTEMEHHSNLVPWHILSNELDIRLEFIPFTSEYLLDLDEYSRLLQLKPRMVSFTHMSNVLGTINPAKQIIQMAHDAGAITLVDGAQSVPHFPVDVQDLNVDFLAFSAHKMLGPTGFGILYGRESLLNAMPPFLGGGDMIKKVQLRSFQTNDIPYKFEAGTPAIAEAVGFGAAIDYLDKIGMDAVAAHEQDLITYTLESLDEIPGINLIGPGPDHKGGVASFTLQDIHPHDIAQILDQDGIAIRAGHHCAMPLHEKLHIPASSRASLYLYSTREEIDLLVTSLKRVKRLFE
jgi:cysteine desulfurase / selenocysteine lyase